MDNRMNKREILLFMFLLLSLVAAVFIGTEIFQITKITVFIDDEIVYNDSDVVSISGIYMGDNIFKLDTSLVKKRIESDPFYEFESITRKYPGEVVIRVQKRSPAATIPYLGSFILIDYNGIILDIQKDITDMEYPIVSDLHPKSFAVGKKLVVSDGYQLKALSRVLEAVYQQNVQDEISEILMGDPDNIFLIVKEGMALRLGQAVNLDDKLRWLLADEFNRIRTGGIKGVFDVSTTNRAVFTPYAD